MTFVAAESERRKQMKRNSVADGACRQLDFGWPSSSVCTAKKPGGKRNYGLTLFFWTLGNKRYLTGNRVDGTIQYTVG